MKDGIKFIPYTGNTIGSFKACQKSNVYNQKVQSQNNRRKCCWFFHTQSPSPGTQLHCFPSSQKSAGNSVQGRIITQQVFSKHESDYKKKLGNRDRREEEKPKLERRYPA